MDKPAFTISVVNSKGGVGKSTTALALAHLIHQATRNKTCLMDFDRQGSATFWYNQTEPAFKLVSPPSDMRDTQLARYIAEESTQYDWLIIDSAPGDVARQDASVEAVAVNGGVVLIPSGTSDLDLPRAVVTLQDVQDRAKAFILLCKTRQGTNALKNARKDLEEIGASVLDNDVPLRESLANATTRGLEDLETLYKPVAEELLEKVG